MCANLVYACWWLEMSAVGRTRVWVMEGGGYAEDEALVYLYG